MVLGSAVAIGLLACLLLGRSAERLLRAGRPAQVVVLSLVSVGAVGVEHGDRRRGRRPGQPQSDVAPLLVGVPGQQCPQRASSVALSEVMKC